MKIDELIRDYEKLLKECEKDLEEEPDNQSLSDKVELIRYFLNDLLKLKED